MNYNIFEVKITDSDIEQKLEKKIKFNNFNKEIEYDIIAEFYNEDLIDDILNENVSYELKRKHYKFIKQVRGLFEKNNIKVNRFALMGTIVDLSENELSISVIKSNSKGKTNNIWPCKEIYIYEEGKSKLDNLLFSNQISIEEYESNLEDLKYELSIYETDEEYGYIN